MSSNKHYLDAGAFTAGDISFLPNPNETVIDGASVARPPHMLKAAIFDFDGVIVLSEEPRFRVLREHARQYGIGLTDGMYSDLAGRTTRSFLKETFPDTPVTRIEEIFQSYSREFKGNILQYVEPVEFVVESIRKYRGNVAFAIASMSDRSVIEKVTRHFGIYDRFQTLTCKDDVTHHKPHPEIYLKTMVDLRVTPAECIAIEDSRVGIRSPLAAGIGAYALMNGTNSEADFKGLNVPFIRSSADLDSLITN